MKILLAVFLILTILTTACFRNVGHYTAKDGSTIYVGIFHNDQPGPGFGPAEIKGTLFDADGNVIDTAGGLLCLGAEPGGEVPFKAWTFADPSKVARIEWKVISPPIDPLLATGLEATVTNTFEAGGTRYVVGEVTNTSKRTYVAAFVCAAWTDKDGTVVREAWNNGGAWRINPGDKVPFSLPVDTPPAGASIHFYLDGGVTDIPGVPALNAVDIASSALQHASQKTTHSADGSYVTLGMGEVHDGTASEFYPDAVAVVRDASNKLLATRGDPSDCAVTAPAGGFTYMTYKVIAPVATPPRITLQGAHRNDGDVYFPRTTALSFRLDSGKHTVIVSGMLKNEAKVTLHAANVCAGLYDAGGVVRGVAMASPDLGAGGLAPGASIPFTVVVSDPGGVVRANAVADGFTQ